MRLTEKEKNHMKIVPECLEDLWFLYTRIDRKIIEQKSLRTKKIKRGSEIIKGRKELRDIAIKVEKKRWVNNKIKVIGKITEGEDRNKYHSFYLELEKEIKIYGLKEKLPKQKEYEFFICLINKNLACIGIYKSGEIKLIKKILAKGREDEFYKEVANLLKKEQREILIVGPIKEKIIKFLDKKVFTDNVHNIRKDGFKELLKRQIIKKVIEKLREEKEKKEIREILVEIKKNPERSCYGNEIANNIDKIKEVLILNNKIPKYENILKDIENKGGKIKIVDSSKEYCKEIENFEVLGIFWW